MALATHQPRAPATGSLFREYRSPGLELLAARLEEPGRHHVLDLGAPRDVNLRFFEGTPTCLYVEDLWRGIAQADPPPLRLDSEEEEPDWDTLVERVLFNRPHRVRYDIVLGWDLFNHLDPGLVTALMKRVATWCRSGTYMFLIVSTAPQMPAEPARVTITPQRRLVLEPGVDSSVTNPRYTPLALERMMPGFRLLHSFLLGDGMQDYLFTFD